MCVACSLLLWLSHFFLQSSHLQWFSNSCGQGLIPMLLVGQSGAALGLSLVRSGICQRCSSTNCRALSLCCPLRSVRWWRGPVVRPAICPSPLGGPQSNSFVCLSFPLPRAEVSGVMLAPFRAACTLPNLWPWFEWALAKSLSERADPQHAPRQGCSAHNVWTQGRRDMPLLLGRGWLG